MSTGSGDSGTSCSPSPSAEDVKATLAILSVIQQRAARKKNHAPIKALVDPIVKNYPKVTAEQLTDCLRLCCDSRSSTITSHALQCFCRLYADGWFSNQSSMTAEVKAQRGATLYTLVEAVGALYGSASVEIQRCVVHCLSTAVCATNNILVVTEVLVLSVRLTRALSLLSKYDEVIKESKESLLKMVRVVCDNLKRAGPSDAGMSPRSYVQSPSLMARHSPMYPTEPAPFGSPMHDRSFNVTPTMLRRSSTTFDANHLGLSSFAPAAADPRQASVIAGLAGSPASASSPRFSLENRILGTRISMNAEGKMGSPQQENFLRFMETIAAVIRPSGITGADELENLETRCRTQSAELLNVIFECLGQDYAIPSVLARPVGQIMIDSTLYCLCNANTMLTLGLSLFLHVVRHVRKPMKHEITVLLVRVLLRIMNRLSCASFAQRIEVVTVVQKICEMPDVLSEFFINNDCDKDCIALINHLMMALSQMVVFDHVEKNWISTFQSMILQHHALRCMTTVVKSIVSLVEFCDSEEAPSWLVECFNMVRVRAVWNHQGWKQGLECLRRTDGDRHKTAENPAALAMFLKLAPSLDKTEIGRFFAPNKEFNLNVYKEYVNLFDFANRPIDVALREIFTAFRMQGEAQIIDRLVQTFANKYNHDNQNVFAGDGAYLLAFSIITLNTLKHNPNAKGQEQSKDDFVRMLRGLNGGNDFNTDMLHAIYDRVSQCEIRIDNDTDPVIPWVDTSITADALLNTSSTGQLMAPSISPVAGSEGETTPAGAAFGANNSASNMNPPPTPHGAERAGGAAGLGPAMGSAINLKETRDKAPTGFLSSHKQIMAHRFNHECRALVREAVDYLRRYIQAYEYSAIHCLEGMGAMFGAVWPFILAVVGCVFHRPSPEPMRDLCMEVLQLGEDFGVALFISVEELQATARVLLKEGAGAIWKDYQSFLGASGGSSPSAGGGGGPGGTGGNPPSGTPTTPGYGGATMLMTPWAAPTCAQDLTTLFGPLYEICTF